MRKSKAVFLFVCLIIFLFLVSCAPARPSALAPVTQPAAAELPAVLAATPASLAPMTEFAPPKDGQPHSAIIVYENPIGATVIFDGSNISYGVFRPAAANGGNVVMSGEQANEYIFRLVVDGKPVTGPLVNSLGLDEAGRSLGMEFPIAGVNKQQFETLVRNYGPRQPMEPVGLKAQLFPNESATANIDLQLVYDYSRPDGQPAIHSQLSVNFQGRDIPIFDRQLVKMEIQDLAGGHNAMIVRQALPGGEQIALLPTPGRIILDQIGLKAADLSPWYDAKVNAWFYRTLDGTEKLQVNPDGTLSEVVANAVDTTTIPENLRVQPNVDVAETTAYPYRNQTFQLKLPSDPGILTTLNSALFEFETSAVGVKVRNEVGKTLSGLQVDLSDPAVFNSKVLPPQGNFCPFVWAIRAGVSPVGNDWMNGALYGFFKDKSGTWVKLTIKK